MEVSNVEKKGNVLLLHDEDVRTVIPNACTLQYLINKYDTFVEIVNQNNNNNNNDKITTDESDDGMNSLSELYQKFRLVCSIILRIDSITFNNNNALSDSKRQIIQSTAYRCYILEKSIEHIQTNDAIDIVIDYNNPDTYLFDLDITISLDGTTQQHDKNTYIWSYQQQHNDECDNRHEIHISLDQDELAEEEMMLIEMANTPTPFEHTVTNSIR